MMTSDDVCVNRIIERPDLFAGGFRNTCCSKSNATSTDIVKKIEIMIKYLTRVSTAKNYSTQIETVLFALAELPYTSISRKLQILSVLLGEVAQNMICCDQTLKEPLARMQTKGILNLVSNFIREWANGEPRETQPCLKICRFCDGVISDEARRHAGKFCCDSARRVDRLLQEWLTTHLPHTAKIKSEISTETEYDPGEIASRKGDSPKANEDDAGTNAEPRSISIVEDDTMTTRTTLEDHYRNHIGSRAWTNSRTSARAVDGRQCNTIPRAALDSRDVVVSSGRRSRGYEATERDRDVIADLSEANGDRSPPRRGKTEASAGGARSDDGGARSADTAAERIRAVRDNNPYRRERAGPIDKDRRQERPAQRDVEEEAEEASGESAGKRGGRTEGDVRDDATAKETASGGPYRRRRRGETRSQPDSARKIGRSYPVEEKAIAEISAEGPEVERDGNGRRREKNEVVARRVRRGAKREGNAFPGESGKTDPLDDAEKRRRGVNEEEKLPAYGEKRKDSIASIGRGREDAGATKGRSTDSGNIRRRDITEKFSRIVDPSSPIQYQLSNSHFVELGWTLLPIVKTVRKIVQYEAKPAKPHLDWFKRYRNKGTVYYDDGLTPFLKFHPDGSGELFYPNGVLAVKVYRPENRKYDMYTVFTPGGKDAFGIERESQILAIFDTAANGVVLDEDGVTRLSYNQIGGIFTDNPTGLPLVWTWNANPRESILQTVYTERPIDRWQMEFFPQSTKNSGNVEKPISQSSPRNKEKKVVEVQKPVVEERQEEVGSKSNVDRNFSEEDILHVKIICLKLNEFLSLRIIDRRNIALRFAAGNKSIRMELGTILNFNKKVASRVVEAIDWRSDMVRCRFQEKLCAKLVSDGSLLDLAKEYRKVKKFAEQRKVMIAKYRPYSKIDHRCTLNGTCKEQR